MKVERLLFEVQENQQDRLLCRQCKMLLSTLTAKGLRHVLL
jgi:hypothetical protein